MSAPATGNAPAAGDQPPAAPHNVCAGPFGAIYNYYIERPKLARLILGLMWGVDPRPFYRSLATVGELPEGATILDVPCGGGVALRGLRAGQRVKWIGVDLEPAMLNRARRRLARLPSVDAQLIEDDMTALPLADGSADLCLSYGGLHCVADPDAALAELVRCLRPGGRLLGSTFLADGSRRQRRLLQEPGFGPTGSSEDLRRSLRGCGLQEVEVDRDDGLAVFSARRAAG